MSASVHPFTRKTRPARPMHPVTEAAIAGIRSYCDDMQEAISEAGSVSEAFSLYQYLSDMAREMACLVDQAGARCEDLMNRPTRES